MRLFQSILFSFFVLVGHNVQSQNAEEIINKYFIAIGGKDAWLKVSSMKSTAKIKTQGMEFPSEMVNKDNKQKMAFSFQGKTIVQPAFDGNTGWQTNFMTMKAEKMEAEDNEIMKVEAGDFPDAFLRYAEKGYTVELQGSQIIEGTDCFKLKLIKKPIMIDGKSEENATTYYFDKESYVPILTQSIIKKGPAKGKISDTVMSDYQEVNGLMFPFTIDQKFDGQVQASISFEKIEINPSVEDKEFEFPADQK